MDTYTLSQSHFNLEDSRHGRFMYLNMKRLMFFFFSSRRRHTRSLCDWSSDVCSSDLVEGRAHDAERVGPGDGDALLAPPAHLVEADSRNRADEREAGSDREEQRQHLIAHDQPRQEQADNRIDDAEEDDIGPRYAEIVETPRKDIAEIGDDDAADRQRRMPIRRSAAYGATCPDHGNTGEPDLIVAPFDGIADLHARPPEPLVREAATARGRTPNRATGHATAATSPETQAYADRRSSSAQIGETERRRGRPTSPAACRRTRRVGGIKMPPSGAARRPLRFLPRRDSPGPAS